jgi:hypothetical protein
MDANVEVREVFFTQNAGGQHADDDLLLGRSYEVAVEIEIGEMFNTFVSTHELRIVVKNLSTDRVVETKTTGSQPITAFFGVRKLTLRLSFGPLGGQNPPNVSEGDILEARASYRARAGIFKAYADGVSESTIAITP